MITLTVIINYLNHDFLMKLIFGGKGVKILDPHIVCMGIHYSVSKTFVKG